MDRKLSTYHHLQKLMIATSEEQQNFQIREKIKEGQWKKWEEIWLKRTMNNRWVFTLLEF